MKRITILGANGAIAVALSKELQKHDTIIRQVSRNPKKVNDGDELFAADLTNPTEVDKAVAGSDIAIVTVGFEYSLANWQKTWPPFMRSVVDACAKHNSKLAFFDNMYMLDHAQIGNMTEETPIKPQSEKGKVRAEVDQIIMEAMNAGKIEAIIARAADFIAVTNSVFGQTLLANLKKGKPADWLISADKLHNFTYVEDAGRALAIVALADDTWNQVWNMPATKAMTGKQWVDLCASVTGTKAKIRVAPSWLLTVLGWFNPIMKEVGEMRYQWANDYVLKSDKLEKRFNFVQTPLADAIKNTYAQLP
jgi:nucleoside-diphosphate-sugar epimerase